MIKQAKLMAAVAAVSVAGMASAHVGFCPLTAKQKARAIADVHFMLVENPHFTYHRGQYVPRGTAVLYNEDGQRMLVWQKSLFYQHPIAAVKVMKHYNHGGPAVYVQLKPSETHVMSYFTKHNIGKHLALVYSVTSNRCAQGKHAVPGVITTTQFRVVGETPKIMSGDAGGAFIMTQHSLAQAHRVATALSFGIRP
jgi:preprotein translocase subunit SecD